MARAAMVVMGVSALNFTDFAAALIAEYPSQNIGHQISYRASTASGTFPNA